MREIGGYFGLEQLVDNEYYNNLLALNCGRNALLYVLKARQINKLFIPYYLCDSISDLCKRYRYQYEYYKINSGFKPEFNKYLHKNEYLLIVNYFGQLTDDYIKELKQKYKQIIIDNTQAFFQKPVEDVDTFYSCRKFFGVPDGGYLSTNKKLDEFIKTDVSKERMDHILGRYEGKASDYHSIFKENEINLSKVPLRNMSKLTKNFMGAIDYVRVRRQRIRNYIYLQEKIGCFNKLSLRIPEVPFSYPFYVECGSRAKKDLSQINIYIPTLWPNVLDNVPKTELEYDYTNNILPLPCDQRYEKDEMEHLVNLLQKHIS